MKLKKALSLLLAMTILLAIVPTTTFAKDKSGNTWEGNVASNFAAGTGTDVDPYQISTGDELAFLASEVNSGKTTFFDTCFKLVSDIDLNNVQWMPIGNSVINMLLFGTQTGNYYFEGTFDGGNHKISNLSIGTADKPYVGDVCGLFGASVGTIKNLTLDGVSIHYTAGVVNNYVLGICGSLSGFTAGSVSNNKVTGLSMTTGVTNSGMVVGNLIGGLVGALDGISSIKNCSVSGGVYEQSGEGSVGGFLGELGKGSSVSYCGSDVNVSSVKTANGAAVGGFAGVGNGETDPSTLINNCYATGNVSGGGYAGGFTGNLAGMNVKNSYATGNVSNSYYGSTFAGSDGAGKMYYGIVENCFTTGTVSDMMVDAYAFFPQTKMERSTIRNCYFNIALTPGINETAVGKSLSDMEKSSFVTELNNGDPTNGWIINENGTPYSGAEPANYDAVNVAIGKIPEDLSAYTDTSIQKLNDAKNAVVSSKNIAEQETVDGYAIAIENAINALTYKGADYSRVNAAIEMANALKAEDYKDFSPVTVAISAVVKGKNITEQAVVDGYAIAIENALNALVKKETITSGTPIDSTVPKDTAQTSDDNFPKMGDTTNMSLWITLLCVSGGAVTMLIASKKRKTQ